MNKQGTKFCALSGSRFYQQSYRDKLTIVYTKHNYYLISGFYLNQVKFDKFGVYDDTICGHNKIQKPYKHHLFHLICSDERGMNIHCCFFAKTA